MSSQDLGLLALDPETASWGDATVDIIAIHGFNGHRETSWQQVNVEDGKSTMWLKNILPYELVPGAQVYSFGYDLSLSAKGSLGALNQGVFSEKSIRDAAMKLLVALDSSADLRSLDFFSRLQHKERPIVFICHDFGGVVVKELLWLANTRRQYLQFALRTRLIIFLGTPHCESEGSSWESMLLKMVMASMNGDILGSEKFVNIVASINRTGSSAMTEICNRFKSIALKYDIVNMYQTQPINGGSLIIPKASAVLGTPNEIQLERCEDHFGLCQNWEDDEARLVLRDAIRKIRRWDKFAGRFYATREEFIPHEPHASEDQLDRLLHSRASEADVNNFAFVKTDPNLTSWVQKQTPSLLWVEGRPGSGKTALCLEVARFLLDPQNKKHEDHDPRPDPLVLYYAIDQLDERSLEEHALVGSLVTQLMFQSHDSEVVRGIGRLRKGFQYRGRHWFHGHQAPMRWPTEDLWIAFRTILTEYEERRSITIIIDGVNQCPPTQQQWLNRLIMLRSGAVGNHGGLFRLLITSTADVASTLGRPWDLEPPIVMRLHEAAKRSRQALIKTRIHNLHLEEHVVRVFRIRLLQCNPTFLQIDLLFKWMELLTTGVKAKKNSRMIHAAEHLMKEDHRLGIYTLYNSIWDLLSPRWKYPSETRSWSFHAIGWLIYASEPLTLSQLSIATAGLKSVRNFTALEERAIAVDSAEPILRQHFGPFLRIENQRVKLYHDTARDFLMERAHEFFPVLGEGPDAEGPDLLDAAEWHCRIATACLRILLLDDEAIEEKFSREYLFYDSEDSFNNGSEYSGSDCGDSDHDAGAEGDADCSDDGSGGEGKGSIAKVTQDDHKDNDLRALMEFDDGNQILEQINQIVDANPTDDIHDEDDDGDINDGDEAAVHSDASEESGDDQGANDTNDDGDDESGDDADDEDDDADLNSRPSTAFLHYAGRNWVKHFNKAIGSGCSRPTYKALTRKAIGFLKNRERVARWNTLHFIQSSYTVAKPLSARIINSPLLLASYLGLTKIIKWLLKKRRTSRTLKLALIIASSNGHVAIVKLILDRISSVQKSIPKSGFASVRAALRAAKGGHISVLKLMLSPKLIDSESDNKLTLCREAVHARLLKVATLFGQISAMHLIYEHMGPLSRQVYSSALTRVAGIGHMEAFNALVKFGANAHDPLLPEDARLHQSSGHLCPLHLASKFGHPGIVDRLLQRPTKNLNKLDTWDRTPLQLASRKGYSKVALRLILAGAVVGRPSWGNDNPLHVACTAGHFETVQVLLNYGADSGADDDGETESPLHNACYNDLDDSRIIGVLCRAGAKVDAFDGPEMVDGTAGSAGDISRDGAEVNADEEAESDSSEYEGPLRPLHIAAIEGKPRMARALIEHGASVDPGDSKGKTPLFYACTKGNFDVVEVLVELGADINRPTTATNRSTPSSIVLQKKHPYMRLLYRILRLGLLWSAASAPDKKGIPPIFRFAASYRSGNANLLKAIVEHSNATQLLMITDSAGRNILDVTLDRQHRETIGTHVAMGGSLEVEREVNYGGNGVCRRVIRGNGVSAAFSCDGRGANCKGVLEGFFYHCRECCTETRAGFDLCLNCYRADETLCKGGRAHREAFEKLFTQDGLISHSVYSPWVEEQKTPAQLKALTPENKRRKPQAQPLTKAQLLQPRELRRRQRSVASIVSNRPKDEK